MLLFLIIKKIQAFITYYNLRYNYTIMKSLTKRHVATCKNIISQRLHAIIVIHPAKQDMEEYSRLSIDGKVPVRKLHAP